MTSAIPVGLSLAALLILAVVVHAARRHRAPLPKTLGDCLARMVNAGDSGRARGLIEALPNARDGARLGRLIAAQGAPAEVGRITAELLVDVVARRDRVNLARRAGLLAELAVSSIALVVAVFAPAAGAPLLVAAAITYLASVTLHGVALMTLDGLDQLTDVALQLSGLPGGGRKRHPC